MNLQKLRTQAVCALAALMLLACGKDEPKPSAAEEAVKVVSSAGDTLKDGGKDAAKNLTEGLGQVVKGVAQGVDSVDSDFKVEMDATAAKHELSAKRATISDHDKKNVKVYFISKGKFEGELQLRAFDAKGEEIGRSGKLAGKLGADDAQYMEFQFDQATPLSRVGKFVVFAS